MTMDTKEGKVLLFVRDYQLKRKVINVIVSIGIPFIEVFEQDELGYKMQLIKDEQKLYIHEYIHDDDKQFEKLKLLKEKGWKTLVIFPKYLIEYIDVCQESKVDDLIAGAVEEVAINNKITTLLNLPIVKETSIEEISADETNNDTTQNIRSVIELEVSRAQRGFYDLSFVIVDVGVLPIYEHKNFIRKLKNTLRETDVIVKTDEKGYYIIVCPFTAKNFLVEVENKIRALVITTTKLYLYGLTLGVDGDDFEELYSKLTENLNNSKNLDQTFKQKASYSNSKFQVYKTTYRKS